MYAQKKSSHLFGAPCTGREKRTKGGLCGEEGEEEEEEKGSESIYGGRPAQIHPKFGSRVAHISAHSLPNPGIFQPWWKGDIPHLGPNRRPDQVPPKTAQRNPMFFYFDNLGDVHGRVGTDHRSICEARNATTCGQDAYALDLRLPRCFSPSG